MKVLIVMAGFFPGKKYGGPPVSVDNFCTLVGDYECYVVTKNHDMGETVPYESIKTGEWLDRGNCRVLYLSDSDYCMARYESIITEIEPNVIYLQGLFQRCIIPCLRLAKKYNIKVLLAPRGELCAGAFKKKYKKIPYIMLLRLMGWLDKVTYQSTSEEETKAIHNVLNAPKDKIFYLTNIPSIPREDYAHVPKELGTANFVFLSRIVPKKNLISAIRYFQNVRGSVRFDIYGSIEDEKYWEECKRAIGNLPGNVSAQYCGLIPHDDVHRVLSSYDAFLLPTFSENFGHVIAEALAVGCPVIISDQTPWTDVNEAGAGWANPLEEEELYFESIQNIVDSSEEEQYIRRIQIKKYIGSKLQLDVLKNNYEMSFRCFKGV